MGIRWNKNEINVMEMLHLLGVIFSHTATGSGKVALRKVIKQNAKPSVSVKQNDVMSALKASGLILYEGKTHCRKYKWNLKDFGVPSIPVAQMMIAETERQVRIRASRSYHMRKLREESKIVDNYSDKSLKERVEIAILNRKPRQAYRWGAKQYLASMEVGETRVDDGTFLREGLRSAACRMKKDFGCEFQFRTKQNGAYRQVTRIA